MLAVLVALVVGAGGAPSPKPMALMLRKNIKHLSATELQGLRDAVKAMKALPASDPCSWTYQANIHNDMCNHTNSYWLPWHRLYLYYFEKILVAKSGGKLKGLPFWSYDVAAETTFPSSFYPSTYGASVPNPLYHTPRTNVTSSAFAVDFDSTDPSDANSNLAFLGFSGSLRSAPHNYIHGAIGGTMGGFLSPLDPIFWPHHCVIDRLWEKWLLLGGGRANPTFDTTWMNQTFTFHDIDAGCKEVTKKVSDTLNTVTQLNYKYVDCPIVIPPIKWWRWFEILPPIPFPLQRDLPFAFAPVRIPLQIPTLPLAGLNAARLRTRNPVNVVLNFKVARGVSTPLPFDIAMTNALGQRSKIATASVFGVRHQVMPGHAGEHAGSFEVTLSPRASVAFLNSMRAGRSEVSFTPRTKGMRAPANVQPVTMRLVSMTLMESAPVDKNGRRLTQ